MRWEGYEFKGLKVQKTRRLTGKSEGGLVAEGPDGELQGLGVELALEHGR